MATTSGIDMNDFQTALNALTENVSAINGKLHREMEKIERVAANNNGYVSRAMKSMYDELANASREQLKAQKELQEAVKDGINGLQDKKSIEKAKRLRTELQSLQELYKDELSGMAGKAMDELSVEEKKIQAVFDKKQQQMNKLKDETSNDRSRYTQGNAKEVEKILNGDRDQQIKNVQVTNANALDTLNKAKNTSEALNQSLSKTNKLIGKMGELLGGVWNQLKDGANMWMDYNQQSVDIARRTGASYDSMIKYQNILIENSKELIRNYGMSAEQTMKMQEAFQEATGKATLLTKDQLNDIGAASRLIGESSVNSAISAMDKIGAGPDQAMNALDKTYARAVNTGLDAVATSKDFVDNLTLANQLPFKNGVDGISKMTVLSERVKLNLQEVAKASDKFSTIEGAIQGSAQLQMLGGQYASMGSNPMTMLYEATSDPEAFYKRITKTFGSQAHFNRKTGESEISPLQMAFIKEGAKAYGISPEEAIKSAKQQAKNGAIDQAINGNGLRNRLGLSDEGKAAIENKAHYDTKTGQWKVSFIDSQGAQRDKSLGSLKAEDMRDIMRDSIDPQRDIQANVRKLASDVMSMREVITGTKQAFSTSKAQMEGNVLQKGSRMGQQDVLQGGLGDFAFGGHWYDTGLTGLGLVGAGALLGQIKGTKLLGKAYNKLFRRKLKPVKIGAVNNATGVEGGGSISEAVNSSSAGETVANSEAVAGNAENVAVAGEETTNAVGGGSKFMKILNNGKLLKRAGYGIAIGAGILEGMNARNEYNTSQEHLDNTQIYGHEREQLDIEDKKKRNEGYGSAIGTTAGGLAGMYYGGLAGTAIGGPIGTVVGGLIGLAAGYVGGKMGKFLGGAMSDESKSDTINKELNNIKEGSTEDNVRKIVLPIENIDNNVAKIANRLGIAASAARGNIYSQMTNEEIQAKANDVTIGYAAKNIEDVGVHVNPTDSNSYRKNYIGRTNLSPLTLNVNGEINLKVNGVKNGSLNRTELSNMLNTSEFKHMLTEMIIKQISRNGNMGRHNKDNGNTMRYTSNNGKYQSS